MPKPSTRAPIGVRPEDELLLCCARTCTNSATAERIKVLLRAGIDWSYLIWSADRHGMLPLVHWKLNAVAPPDISADALSNLHDYFEENVRRNLFLTGELLGLLKLLKSNGIPAVPYKGPVLAQVAYNNFALRDMCDLDIFIRREDLKKALHVLEARGYLSPVELNSERAIQAYLARNYAYTVTHCNGSLVDLHWAITPKYLPFSPDQALWSRLEPVELAGVTTLNFSKEDLLLFLCVHGAKHYWRRLEWICCLAELLRNYQEIDWRAAIARARAWGVVRMLLLGLLLARDLSEVELPEAVGRRIEADPTLRRLAERVRERLFRETGSPPGIVEEFLFYLTIRERPVDRLRYSLRFVLRRIPPNVEDRALLPLPRPLCFLHYLIRPVRLVQKYVLRVESKDSRQGQTLSPERVSSLGAGDAATSAREASGRGA